MKRLIESVANTFQLATPLVKFELDLEPNVYFKGYADNYRIVIENIIDNATRYAKTLIKITLKDNYLEFFNDGEPIDEKFVTQGFKAYEKGSHGKFGLGMSIACKTLEFFNYTLVVKNVKNGVSFTITPLSQLEKNVDKGL
jgi:two-component system sensor histidine kinase CssS